MLLCWQVDLPRKQDDSTAVRGRPLKFHLDVPTHLSVRDFYSQCSVSGSRTLLSSLPLTTLRPVSTLSSPLSQLLATMVSTSPLPYAATGSKCRASYRARIRRLSRWQHSPSIGSRDRKRLARSCCVVLFRRPWTRRWRVGRGSRGWPDSTPSEGGLLGHLGLGLIATQ